MEKTIIQQCTREHLDRYGEIYAAAFSGEPWNDHWSVEDATVHVGEILDSKQSYGLEYLVDGQVAGFILGASMLFHYGRTFEINDLAVSPEYQGRGIASLLLDRLVADLREQGINKVCLVAFARNEAGNAFWNQIGWMKKTNVNYYEFILNEDNITQFIGEENGNA